MLTQIVNGFLALAREGIIHRDLKPANIMIKDNILKIGDFGFAKKIPNGNFKNKTVVGTPLYMSLQILKN
jgi:serine/threonine-protein kinase ULK/ATG1